MSNASSPIHVAFALDERFLGYTAVAAISAALATKNLHVHVLHSDDLGPGAEKLDRLVKHHGGNTDFYKVKLANSLELPVSGHVSIATYFRLSIADVIPKRISRVIYLDGDIIVRRSLSELYNLKVAVPGVAAVAEPHLAAVERLGMAPGTPYLNSGVLVLDLDIWRREAVTRRLYEIAKTSKHLLKYWDQDLLALFLQGQWTHLSPVWNVNHRYFFGENRLSLPSTEPAIVHFSGERLKPLDAGVDHPYASEFWHFAKLAQPFGFELRPSTPKASWTRRLSKWALSC